MELRSNPELLESNIAMNWDGSKSKLSVREGSVYPVLIPVSTPLVCANCGNGASGDRDWLWLKEGEEFNKDTSIPTGEDTVEESRDSSSETLLLELFFGTGRSHAGRGMPFAGP